MAPTLRSGELVLVNRLTFRLRAARRHEIVVVQHPDRPDLLTIKRIVGLPGEHVRLEAGGLWIDSRPVSEPYLRWPAPRDLTRTWQLDRGAYLVLGDNRADSRDSREFGPVRRSHLLGPVWYRYWPPERRGEMVSD